MATKNVKKRNWAFVLYPESAPENWRELLQQTGLQCVISPLHDKDLDPDGNPKKAHHHIILVYSGPTSFNVVKQLTESLKQPIPQALEQVRGYYRYLTHKDNPEKAQYNQSDLIAHGGVDLADLLRPSSSERYQIIADMQNYVLSAGITEFQDLMDYARTEHFDDWFPLLCDSCTFVMSMYIKSQRHRSMPFSKEV